LRRAKSDNNWHARLKRLAENIETLAKRDEVTLSQAREILEQRHVAAQELHGICTQFVTSVNEFLPQPIVQLAPSELAPGGFLEYGNNLFQINTHGRILQVEFKATEELVSTEEFRIPYTLEGTVRAFNQSLLDKDLIEEQLLFYTLEAHRKMWRFFDARTYRSGPFDLEYLISLMEEII
jgi:hypothetical protein